MRHYCFNKQELLQKAKEKYENGGKEKAAKYYQANKVVLKEKQGINIEICQKKKKTQKGNIQKVDTTK